MPTANAPSEGYNTSKYLAELKERLEKLIDTAGAIKSVDDKDTTKSPIPAVSKNVLGAYR